MKSILLMLIFSTPLFAAEPLAPEPSIIVPLRVDGSSTIVTYDLGDRRPKDVQWAIGNLVEKKGDSPRWDQWNLPVSKKDTETIVFKQAKAGGELSPLWTPEAGTAAFLAMAHSGGYVSYEMGVTVTSGPRNPVKNSLIVTPYFMTQEGPDARPINYPIRMTTLRLQYQQHFAQSAGSAPAQGFGGGGDEHTKIMQTIQGVTDDATKMSQMIGLPLRIYDDVSTLDARVSGDKP